MTRWLAAVALCPVAVSLTGCPSSPARSDVLIHVGLEYADQEDGLTRPVIGVVLQVMAHGPGVLAGEKEVTTGTTDASGGFSATLPAQEPDLRYSVRVKLVNDSAECCSGWVVPGMRYPDLTVITLGMDQADGIATEKKASAGQVEFAHTFTGDTASAFNILDVVRNMATFVRRHEQDVSDDKIGRARIGIDKKTWFDPVAYTVDFVPRTRWRDRAIRHEYGHYVQAQIGSLAWIASTHTGCTPKALHSFGGFGNGPGFTDIATARKMHAWLEGFADWLGDAAYADNPDLYSHDSSFGSLEQASCAESGPWPEGDRFENHVAAFLWDMTDPYSAAEPDDVDGGAQQISSIITAVDTDLDRHKWPEVFEFSVLYLSAGSRYPAKDSVANAMRNKISTIVLN
ncbi:hypothetical protein OHA70_22415 [Kribbella sp. NBC_00382]|uniref:hypothetical protein n=1 Tax=Kribbella sp. NBC_00382 TaxID=2975967 RepID=UPI002E23CA86